MMCESGLFKPDLTVYNSMILPALRAQPSKISLSVFGSALAMESRLRHANKMMFL